MSRSPNQSHTPFRLWFWLVVAATLWAALLRLPGLATLPPQAWFDEAWYNVAARDLLRGGPLPAFYPTAWGGMRPLLVVLTAAIQGLGIHSLVASRGITALSGVLAVPLTFAACDEFLRREAWPPARRRLTAAVAALVGSSLIFPLVASRIGQAPILIPLLALAAAWQMRRAERTRRRLGWVLAGLALGLAQYVNLNAAFVLAVIGLLAVFDLVRAPGGQRRGLFTGLLLMGVVAGLAALPLALFFLRQPQWLFIRAGDISPQHNQLAFFLDNARLILLSFSLRGDANPRNNVPFRPMLDWIELIGFWAGVVWALWRSRRSPTAVDLLAWLGVTCLPSLLSLDAPHFERMIGAAAPVPMLVAVGWSAVWQRLSPALAGRQSSLLRWAPTVAAVGLGLASLGAAAYVYFGLYPRTPGLAAAFTATPATVAQQMLVQARSQPVFVERFPEIDEAFAFDFLFAGTTVRRVDFRQCLPAVEAPAAGATYLVLAAHDAPAAAALQRLYPRAALRTIQTEGEAEVGDMAVVQVPAGARLPPISRPVPVSFQNGPQFLGYDWSGPTVVAGQSLSLTLYWTAGSGGGDATAFVHVGRGQAGSPLVAQHDAPPCGSQYPTSQWQAGEIVLEPISILIPAGTPPGDYPLLLGLYNSGNQQRLALASAENALPDSRAIIGTLAVTAP